MSLNYTVVSDLMIELLLQELRDISSMAMEHFDEKIVPTFKVNPQSPAAAAIAVVTTCGHNSVTPSKILSGSFMSMSGPSYLGVPSISSPVFGSTNSTPKGSVNSKSFNKGLLFNETGEIDTGSVISKIKSIEKNLQEKVDKNHKALQTTIKRQRRMMKKMKNVSCIVQVASDLRNFTLSSPESQFRTIYLMNF